MTQRNLRCIGEVARDMRGHGIRKPDGSMYRDPAGCQVRNAFGRLMACDVGRRVYAWEDAGGLTQLSMESLDQRDARREREASPFRPGGPRLRLVT